MRRRPGPRNGVFGVILSLAFLVASGALLPAVFSSPALAAHDVGQQCYDCHNIKGGSIWNNSYSIWSGKAIGMRPYGRPITCDVCHTDYGMKFNNVPANLSRHPVRLISGDNTLADNNVYGSSPAYVDCRDCHVGNPTTPPTAPLNPDVSPASYSGLGGNTASDGYPNHDNTITGSTITAASWSGQNVVTGGTEPHLGSSYDTAAAYNKVPSADNIAALLNYALCFSCHDGSAGRTNRRVDVKTKYAQGAGHYYKSSGNRMPCSDCHASHNSSSSRLYAKPLNAGTPGAVVYSSPAANPSLAADVRKLCMDCHDDWNVGNTTNGTPLIRGVEPSGRKHGVTEHDSASLVSCTTSGCHDAHDAPAQCNGCHGYGGDGSGAPPNSPTAGNRIWSSSVDRIGTKLTQGMHRSASSDNVMRTDHEGYGCSECHTSTPGSGGTHNDGGLNATMDNLAARKWTDLVTATTFTPRTDGATGSVADDSCNNVNCHSSFGPYQATQPSGTPFRYERYWENYNLWDCYTCHGYRDSDGVPVDNTNNPGSLDRQIDTGAHDRHTRTVAKGGMGYDCVRCHETGNAAKYSSSAPAGDNTYPGTHKTGLVEWTFAGAPNPFGVAAASRTYSNSQLGGATFVPTDNGSTHRRYGSCANLYCHSLGQHPTTGLALTAGDNTHYRPPKWDNTFGGKCGDCHGGNGATDNAASIMTTGSHRQHDNTAPYAYACGICHNGLGRGSVKHVDNQVSLAFGAALPGGATVTASYSQGLDNNAGNGYGNCTATYCHGTDGNPALRLSGGANQATGTTNRPTWGDNTTGNCGSCHGAPGATTNYAPGTYVGTQNWPGGAHALHVSDNVTGPNPSLACTDCHTASNVSTHVDGRVDFRKAWDNAAATDKAGTNVCNPCHGSVVSEVKANWDNTSYVSNCLGCHGSTAAYAYKDGTGRMAPAVDNGAYGANTTGHNRSAGNYTGSGNGAANSPLGKTACTVCHKASLLHINNIADNSYAGNRLSDNVNAQTGRTTISLLCAACHTNTGSATAVNNNVNTHGNTGFTGINHDNTGAQGFVYNCDACHDSHGMTNNGNGSGLGYNIFMIKASVEVRNFSTGVDTTPDNTTTVGPVRFESTTGPNSFDDNASANGNRLCVTCHVSVQRPGNSTALNVTGGGGSHSGTPGGDYTTDERGQNCASCHNHNKDDNTSTVDGLMPQACNGCHSYPGLDNAISPKQMTRGHWDHVGQPGAGGTANSRGFLCAVCHLNYAHNQSNILAGGSWAAFNPNTVNIRFDNTWNPVNASGPRYNSILADPANGTVGIGGTGAGAACAGLNCHGGNATLNAGWNGSGTSPRWDNTSYACGACHDTGTGDTTAGTRMSTGNHPVHLDNASKPYGPETWRLTGSGANCSDGTGCHTAYGLSPAATHGNNQVSFRTDAGDNAAVNLASTGICVNCHSTYTNAGNNLPASGNTLVRTQANWDNASYQVPCITCHNDSLQAPPNPSQGTVQLSGGGNRAPNILAAYYGNGHGASGIDNGTTSSAPPIPCMTCHFEAGGHIGGGKTASNPWRLDNALTKYAQAGGLDNYCMTACHANASPAKHAWIRVGVGASAKDNATQTHPASIPSVPQSGEPAGETMDKSRWTQVTLDTTMPLGGTTASPASGDLNSDPIPARLSTAYGRLVMCVTCHDPHGVGTAPIAPRTFSGTNTDGYEMLRYRSGGSLTALCAKCHK